MKASVFICTPVYGTMHAEVALSMYDAARYLESEGYTVLRPDPLVGCSMIHIARTELLHRFLLSKADVMLTFDSDTAFDPSSITTSVKAIVEEKADIIGCAYVSSRGNGFSVDYWQKDIDKKSFRGFEFEEHQFIDVKAVGTGVFLVSRRAVVQMIENLPETRVGPADDPRFLLFDFKPTIDGELRGEDYTFCDYARRVGLEIYCCTTAKTTHYVRFGYTGDMRKQLEDGGAEFEWNSDRFGRG